VVFCVNSCLSPTCTGNCTKNATAVCNVCTHLDGIYHFEIDCITGLLTVYPNVGCTIPTSTPTTLVNIPNGTCSPGYTNDIDVEHFITFNVCPCTEYCWQQWFTPTSTNFQCRGPPSRSGNFCCGRCETPSQIFSTVLETTPPVGSFIVDCDTRMFIPYSDPNCLTTLSVTGPSVPIVHPFNFSECFAVNERTVDSGSTFNLATWKILECDTGPSQACFREYESNTCGDVIYQQGVNLNTCQIITPIVANAFGANLTNTAITTYLNTDCTIVTNAPGYDICFDFLHGGSGRFTLGNCSTPDPPSEFCIAQFLSLQTSVTTPSPQCNPSDFFNNIVITSNVCTELAPNIWGILEPASLSTSPGTGFFLIIFSSSSCTVQLTGGTFFPAIGDCLGEDLFITTSGSEFTSYQARWLHNSECDTCTEYCMSSWHPLNDVFSGPVRNSDCSDAPTATVTYCCGRCYTECELWNVSCGPTWSSWTGHKGILTDCSTHITKLFADEFCEVPHQPTSTATDVYNTPVGECASVGPISSFRADYGSCPICPQKYCMETYGSVATTIPPDPTCEGDIQKRLSFCCDDCYDMCQAFEFPPGCDVSTFPVSFKTNCNTSLTTIYGSNDCTLPTSLDYENASLGECVPIEGGITSRVEFGNCPSPICQPYCLQVWSPNNFPGFPSLPSSLDGNCSGSSNAASNFCCGLCYDACALFQITGPECESGGGFSFQIDCVSQVSYLFRGRSCSQAIDSHSTAPFGYRNVSLGECADFFDEASWRVSAGTCVSSCFREYSSRGCISPVYTQDVIQNSCQLITPIFEPSFSAFLNSTAISTYLNPGCSVLTGQPGYDICFNLLGGASGKFTLGNCSLPDPILDNICIAQYVVHTSTTTAVITDTFHGPLCNATHFSGNLALAQGVCTPAGTGIWIIADHLGTSTSIGSLAILIFSDPNCTNEIAFDGFVTQYDVCHYTDYQSTTFSPLTSYQFKWLPIEDCETCTEYCMSGWFPDSTITATSPVHNPDCKDAPTETTTFCCDHCYPLCDLFNLTNCGGDAQLTWVRTDCSTHVTKWYLDSLCLVPITSSSSHSSTFNTPVGHCQPIHDTSSFMVNYNACPVCTEYCVSAYGLASSTSDIDCELSPSNALTTCCGQCYDLCRVLDSGCPSSTFPFSFEIDCNTSTTTIFQDSNCTIPVTASSSAFVDVPIDECIPLFSGSWRTQHGACPTTCEPYCLEAWSGNNLFSSSTLPSTFNPTCSGAQSNVTNFCCGICYDACVLFGVNCPEAWMEFGGLSFQIDCFTQISTLYQGEACDKAYPANPSFGNTSLGQCADFKGRSSWRVEQGTCPPPYCFEIWSPGNFPSTQPPISSSNGFCLGIPQARETLFCDRCYDACVLFDVNPCEFFSTFRDGLSLSINCATQNTTLYFGPNCNETFTWQSSMDQPGANVSLGQCDNYFGIASWRTTAGTCLPLPPPPPPAPCVSYLGNATGFAVLGASTVSNTGSSVITGDLGLYPGTSVTGICSGPPGVVIGTCHITDSAALDAKNALTAAIITLNGLPCDVSFGVPTDIGGMTLLPGVYCFASSAQITGILTLNAQGNPNALFVFQIGSTLTTASSASVILINGGAICNIYWVVGSSATLGSTTTFLGNILATASITLITGATASGRLLAQTAAVTLDTNTVTLCATCNNTNVTTPTPSPTPGINLFML
jgi:hypothetical protein